MLGNKPPFSLDLNQAQIEQRKNKIADIIKLSDKNNHEEMVKIIISELFPHAGEASYHGHDRYYRTDKRVCSSDRFDKYFLLDIPKGEISQNEIDNALKIINDKQLFINLLKEYKDNDILMDFLDRLKDYTKDISCENIKSIIDVFLEIGDELSMMNNGRINRNIKIRMGLIVFDFIEKIEDPVERANILKDRITNTKGFYILLYVIFKIKESMDKEKLLSNQEFQTIKELTAMKIREAASKDDFIKKPHLNSILFRWRDFDDPNEPKRFVSRLIDEDYGVIKILVEFLTVSINDDGFHYSLEDHNLEELSEFADLSDIYSKIILIKKGKPYLLDDKIKEIAIDGFIYLFEQRYNIQQNNE